jgi:class III poly(R)-hydroxyalkanoic acid synthase PhaE subunit
MDWADAQKRYLETLSALGAAGRPAAGSPNPWGRALQDWWRQMQPAVPEKDRELFSTLVDQCDIFCALAGQFSELLAAMSSPQTASGDWRDVLSRHVEDMKAGLSRSPAGGTPFGPEVLAAALQIPLDAWQRAFYATAAPPADVYPDLKGAEWPFRPDRFVSMAGPGREIPEQAQELLQLWAAAQNDYSAWQAYLTSVGSNALDRLHARILEIGDRDGTIGSVRALYDLWVDCSEAAWTELAFTEEFATLFGNLVNSMLACRRHVQQTVDGGLAGISVPTQRDLEAMQKRQQETRRELRAAAAQRETDAQLLAGMRRELESLKARLDQAVGASSPAPVHSPPIARPGGGEEPGGSE